MNAWTSPSSATPTFFDKLCVLFNILCYDELKNEPSGICPGSYLVSGTGVSKFICAYKIVGYINFPVLDVIVMARVSVGLI